MPTYEEYGAQADQEISGLQTANDLYRIANSTLESQIAALQKQYDDHMALPHDGEGSDFVSGQTKPDIYNVGRRKPITRVEKTAASITSSGKTYEGIRFEVYPDLSKAGSGNIFRDCEIVGPRAKPPGGRHLIKHYGTARETRFEFCEIYPQIPHPEQASLIMGHDYTFYRCLGYGAVDGWSIMHPTLNAPHRVRILDSLIYNLGWWKPYAKQSDNQTHCDLCQTHGHMNDVFVNGSAILGSIDPRIGNVADLPSDPYSQNAMSLLMMSPKTSGAKMQNVTYEDNWLDGILNFANYRGGDIANVVFRRNRMGARTRLAGNYLSEVRSAVKWENNVKYDGSPWTP